MFVKLGLALLVAAGSAPVGAAPPKIGEFAPPFLLKTMNKDLSGLELFSTKHYVGSTAEAAKKKNALLINFSASYCGPCKKELPELKAVAEKYAERKVMFAFVVIDKKDEGVEEMRKLTVEELGIKSPVLSDRLAIVGRRYGAENLPLSVIVSAEGKIHWMRSGYEKDTISSIEAELEKLAAPPPAPPDEEVAEPKKKKKKRKKKKRKKK